MKRVILLLLTSFLFLIYSSCSTVKPLPGNKSFTAYDFTEYSEQGFLFTPEGYDGNYKSVGMVNVNFWPAVQKPENADPNKDYLIRKTIDGGTWFVEKLNMQTAIDSMYSKASNMGADAVIRFNPTYQTKNHYGLTIIGIELRGFAIKRKDK